MTAYRLECFRLGFIGTAEAHPLRQVQALIRYRANQGDDNVIKLERGQSRLMPRDKYARIRLHEDGRYHITTVHPYDLTEYHYALSMNQRDWTIARDCKPIEQLVGTVEQCLKRMRMLDKTLSAKIDHT